MSPHVQADTIALFMACAGIDEVCGMSILNEYFGDY